MTVQGEDEVVPNDDLFVRASRLHDSPREEASTFERLSAIGTEFSLERYLPQ